MVSVSPFFQRTDTNFWPRGEIENFFSDDFILAEEGFFGKSSTPTVGEIDRSDVSDVLEYIVQSDGSIYLPEVGRSYSSLKIAYICENKLWQQQEDAITKNQEN